MITITLYVFYCFFVIRNKDVLKSIYAAPVLYEDGRYWEKYCDYMHNDSEIYKEKNVLEHIREYNFCEDAAMKLIDKTS